MLLIGYQHRVIIHREVLVFKVEFLLLLLHRVVVFVHQLPLFYGPLVVLLQLTDQALLL